MIRIPKSPNEETRLAAAKETAKALIEDAGVEGDLEEIAADVAKHCRYGDGFQMAKDLEHALGLRHTYGRGSGRAFIQP